jgi:glycosyltransferase involved in cell wall biosynthesis
MNLLLVVPSLHLGGTERQAVAMLNGLTAHGHLVRIATLYPGGELERDLDESQIIRINKKGRWDVVSALLRLQKIISLNHIDVTYSLLGTPNIMCAMLKPFISSKLAWGIRASEMHLTNYGRLARISEFIETRLSSLPDIIISNSNSGKTHARTKGYPDKKMHVVPNGIDTEAFQPDKSRRLSIRSSWGIRDGRFLIGIPARIDPIKDHPTFLRAAALAARHDDNLRFACIGGGNAALATRLTALATELGIAEKVVWPGQQWDMKAAYNALDLACLSSLGEGFSNALSEAMACGIPCTATDAGDNAHIIGETGIVVDTGDHEALAQAFLAMKKRITETSDISAQCRERIVTNFSLPTMVENVHSLLSGLVTDHPRV